MSSLPPQLESALLRALAEAGGPELTIRGVRPVGGGSIHRAAIIQLSDGSSRFVKHSPGAPADMFPREAEGLQALADADAIRVPRDPVPGETDEPGGSGGARFLVMEAIDTGRPGPDFFARFGRAFAELHRRTVHSQAGFAHDNYIGSTPQPNGWMDDWCDFFRRHRLGFQLDLARENGVATRELSRLGDRLLDRLDTWLDLSGEPCCLLHGDLWSGNYLCDAEGESVLIDPAVYYGHREADLAMTRLFGGFDRSFYRAYEESWPLPGSPTEQRERHDLYQLYHLLNHLNLFGRGYLSQCLSILRSLT